MKASFRKEKDSLGTLEVPKKALYGIHTQRSINNFKISSIKWHKELINSIVKLKKSCAKANCELGLLNKNKTEAIVKAADQILKKDYANEFPLDIFQAGSGTSTNMNVNEVLANLAMKTLKGKEKIHPNDDVNKGQSTNNIIPSAIRLASLTLLEDLTEEMEKIISTLDRKTKDFSKIIKSGRTHLQDAVPITLAQEFRAYQTAMEKHIQRIDEAKIYLKVLGVGGNAVGTGLNTKPKFRELIIKHLNKHTGFDFKVSNDGIESTQFLTDIAALSGVLRLLAIDINKICNDLRLLSSGPKTGLGEINLPAVEPGSSIMPGKINPSIPEAVNMVCHKILGNDLTISISCTSGNLDLNTHMPIIGQSIVESTQILTNAIKTLNDKCIKGITANEKQCKWYVENSMALATALNPHIGYDKASELVKESLKTGKTVKEIVIKKGLLKKEELNKILDPKNLTKPNL